MELVEIRRQWRSESVLWVDVKVKGGAIFTFFNDGKVCIGDEEDAVDSILYTEQFDFLIALRSKIRRGCKKSTIERFFAKVNG